VSVTARIDLADHVAIVTGGGKGIWAQMARLE
jgi:NAD(P)-dependent dehydrogenase (short-subunit alcohol dehydrogenase family)